MRALVRFVARLYPPRWRQRYGAEFEALLEDADPNAKTAFNVFAGAISMQVRTWSVGKILMATGLAGLLVAGGIALTLRRQYASTSLLRVTAPQSVEGRVFRIANDIKSPGSLARLVRTLGLYPREITRMPLEDVIDRMQRNIHIVFFSASSTAAAFGIQFEYPDPVLAQKVTMALTSRFVEENLSQHGEGPALVQVVAAAKLPREPSFPNIRGIAAGGLAGGLVLGGVLGFFFRRAGVHA